VCALSSNLKRASEPGNVLLELGEGDLEKQSVVVVLNFPLSSHLLANCSAKAYSLDNLALFTEAPPLFLFQLFLQRLFTLSHSITR
jgi:hypothetical protein